MKTSLSSLYPAIIPVIITALFEWYHRGIYGFLELIDFQMSDFFSGTFNFSTVLTGFLFSIYCFIIVTSNPFIERIQKSKTFQEVKGFLVTTTVLGLLSGIFSLLLSCFKLGPDKITRFQQTVLDGWMFIFLLTVFYFLCAVRHFMVLSNDMPVTRTPGG
jgi:hypothetical protein